MSSMIVTDDDANNVTIVDEGLVNEEGKEDEEEHVREMIEVLDK